MISLQPLAVPGPHLLSPFLAHKPSPHWKSQIVHLDMHHLVSGINFHIHSVSLASHVSIHLLIHLSTHLCYLSQLSSSIERWSTVIRNCPVFTARCSFTVSHRAQNLHFQQILPTLINYFWYLMILVPSRIMGLDRTYPACSSVYF